MKTIKSIISPASFLVFVISLILNSCGDPTEFFSQEYRIAPEEFSVQGDSIEASQIVDLSTGAASIKATFSHPVNYTMKIRGLESGAEKQTSGMARDLNYSWIGDHDGLAFFKEGELAVIELTFLGSNRIVTDTIRISKTKKFGSQGLALANNFAYEGFEGPTFGFNTLTWNYGIYGDGVFNDDANNDIDISLCGYGAGTKRDTMNPSAGEIPIQGKYALTLAGKDERAAYFVGGIKRTISNAERSTLPSDPQELYANLYIYGRGDANSKLNYSFEEAGGDIYEKQFTLDHQGWKLFSIKYSDLTVVSPGNGIREPRNLTGVGFNLISAPPGNTVRATFDYPILTFGSSFNPHN